MEAPSRLRTLILPVLAAAVLVAACGGDDDEEPATAPAPTTERPTATTGEPPGARRGPPPGETVPGDATERAGASYTCDGRELTALRPEGPVRVEPSVVEPGGRFTVTVTDPKADVAFFSLTGVADVPISARAERSAAGLRVRLRMPEDASCGNKLVTVEGDVSAQAFVAVGS